jgi:hypothetical protein
VARLAWGLAALTACGRTPLPTEAQRSTLAGFFDDRLSDIVEIQLYGGAACARDSRGNVYCWGDQYEAAEIDGGSTAVGRSNRPRKIHGIEGAVRLSSSENRFGYATAVLAGGEVVAWPHVDLRPLMAPAEPVDEKIEGVGAHMEITEHARNKRRRPAEDPWRATPTGITVGAIDLFADTGCIYSNEELACPRVPRGVDVPNYDALELRRMPGIVDIAFISGYNTHERGACIVLDDGTLRCNNGDSGGAWNTIDTGARVRAIFGGLEVVMHLEDGRVVRTADARTLVIEDGIVDIEQLDVDVEGGLMCGIATDQSVSCWNSPEDDSSRRRVYLLNIENPVQVQVSPRSSWCVLEQKGHVKCGGMNDAGECGSGTDVLSIDGTIYTVAPRE